MTINELRGLAEEKRQLMIELTGQMVAIPSINPAMGGSGEYRLAQWLEKLLDSYGIPYEEFSVPDPRVAEGRRVTVIVKLPGTEETDKTLWFISHTDTVSPGALSAWDTDPFQMKLKDGKLYGLGAEDNGQGIICSLAALLILWERNLRARCNIGFMFVPDEETGSAYGFKALAESGYFASKDEAIIPDGGQADGAFVEVAEKSFFLLKVNTSGKQAHAASPLSGINAFSIGSRFLVEAEDTLKERFCTANPLFDPPFSTFEPTQKFANVESHNIIPGEDSFLFDMRILPEVDLNRVEQVLRDIATRYEYRYKVKIGLQVIDKAPAPPPTSPDSPVAQRLISSLREAGVQARCGGIGGGTCAEFLRRLSIPAAVWSTVLELAHQPNEYALVDNLVNDTAIFLSVIEKYC